MPAAGRAPLDREEKAERAQLSRDQAIDDLNWLMSDKRGRRVMHGLLGECGIYRQSYTPGDTHATSFLEGVRSVGLKLMGRISEHCPGRMSEMFKEVKANGSANPSA